MFGKESVRRVAYSDSHGPLVDESYKRKNILNQINKVLKINGLFLNKVFRRNDLCFSDKELEDAGFIDLGQMNPYMYAFQKNKEINT